MKYEQAVRDRTLSAEVALTKDGTAALRGLHIDDAPAPTPEASTTLSSEPKYSWPSGTTYRVCYLPNADIELTGRADDPIWQKANVEKQFAFPWKKSVVAPPTEFRAFCTKKYLYFAFHVVDADIVLLDTLNDKQDIVDEDRVELFFSCDPGMKDYYGFEIDSKGRTYDYRAAFYRKFDPTWGCPGLETKASLTPNGYIVEGRIPLQSLIAMGFHELKPGEKILCGIYRAEFSHAPSQSSEMRQTDSGSSEPKPAVAKPIQDWISWIAPDTPTPDFHLPGSLGWLEITGPSAGDSDQ